MKFFTRKSMIQKIIILLIMVMLLINFTAVPYVYADEDGDDGWSLAGTLAKEITQLFAWIGDMVMGALNNIMLGANGFDSAMLNKNDKNLDEGSGSWLATNEEADEKYTFTSDEINTNALFGVDYKIPNMLYSPENIFANNIAALDINFLRENTYQSIYVSGDNDFKENAEKKAVSATVSDGDLSDGNQGLRTVIAGWYRSFRNISVVALLSILIYLGIRILISSTAEDKAKYKETLIDWFVALCLVFAIHFIMSFILMITDRVTDLFATSINEGIVVEMDDIKFKTNLMGLIRFKAQAYSATQAATYTVIYIALVIYTCIFTFIYLKRFLYMAFFTMIAPLVSLTYPIDRAGDGKAQAFNLWFKEYTMNAIIQPVHLILYTVFVTSAYDLATDNPLYALVAIAFLVPAEKFIKKMFGMDKAETTNGLGAVAGGALAMKGFNYLANSVKGKDREKQGEKGDSNTSNKPPKTFFPDSKNLDSFKNGDESDESNQDRVRTANESFDESGDKGQNVNSRNQQAGQSSSEMNNSIGNDTKMNRKPKAISGYMGRVAKRGIKSAGRQIWNNKGKIGKTLAKGAMRTAGTLAGGTVGLAAGITTGDMSKAMSMMAGGAVAGNTLGAAAYSGASKIGNIAVDKSKDLKNVMNEEKYGLDYAIEEQKRIQNRDARKAFMKDKNEKAKYEKIKADLVAKGYNGDLKNVMESAADYMEAGITDEDLIKNSLKAEFGRDKTIGGGNHNKFVEVAAFSHKNGIGKDTIEDEKKLDRMETVIQTESGLKNPNAQRELAQTLAEIYGRGNYYKSVGKLGKDKK